MNIRQRHELRLLAERGEFSLERVAESYGVTLRSIRYDIDELNNRLYSIIESDAIVVRAKTARLKEGVPRNMLMALASTGADDFTTDVLSQRERVLIIVSMLCWSDDFVTIQEFADTFGVSRATATRDFAKVYSYCEEHGLAVERSRGKGARVVASEQDRRRMFTQAIRDCRATGSSHVGFDPADYTTWFPREDLEHIAAIVRDASVSIVSRSMIRRSRPWWCTLRCRLSAVVRAQKSTYQFASTRSSKSRMHTLRWRTIS